MLERFVAVVGGMALPFLLVSGLAVVLVPHQPRGWEPSSRWRAACALTGLVAGSVFAVLRATAVLRSRSAVSLPTLYACVAADVVLLVLLAAQVGRPRWGGSGHLGRATNVLACVVLALAFFRAVPETVLQLTAFIEPGRQTMSSEMLLRVLGFLSGWVACAVLAFLAYRAARRSPVRLTRLTVCAFMALVLFTHATDLLTVLHANHRIVLHGAAFRLLVWLTNNAQSTLLITTAAVLLVPLAVAAGLTLRRAPAAANPARARAAVAGRRRTRRWVLATALGVGVLATTRTYGVAKVNEVPVLSEPEPYRLEDGTAYLALATLEDGHLHRFEYKASNGAAVRFIVILKNGGAYGVGLDACENCGPSGYYEKDGKVICKRCDVAINPATIGFKGGCNPIPLAFDVVGGDLAIAEADLEAAKKVFA